jgi:predicted nucleic acid-binding protein
VIVLDASALVELILDTPTGHAVAGRIADPSEGLHVPHLADIEVAQALRRYVREGEIDVDTAETALDDLRALDLQRHAHEPLLERVWELRKNLTAYDAVYVALAEVLDGVVLTCDRRLSQAPGMTRRVTLVGAERSKR